jgi:hypothetical protein
VVMPTMSDNASPALTAHPRFPGERPAYRFLGAWTAEIPWCNGPQVVRGKGLDRALPGARPAPGKGVLVDVGLTAVSTSGVRAGASGRQGRAFPRWGSYLFQLRPIVIPPVVGDRQRLCPRQKARLCPEPGNGMGQDVGLGWRAVPVRPSQGSCEV